VTDKEGISEANQRFYSAFETLDIEQMRAVWDEEYGVTCVHPGWPLIQGRGEVLQSWANIFTNTMVMQFTITEASVVVEGDWAWVVCTEGLRSVVDGRVTEGKIEATNVFRKRGERWLLVHHHGSPVM
jgi:ketosteroid isomerase-like protein